ncbi:MAG TPA: tryptophan synthase subunit alpha [Anaerolineae bacterium]|nr:tryptophan synthase subunit alpha [Anaerolineae bacterium]
MRLRRAIETALAAPDKNILLMTHLVLGYPSFATNRQVIAAMVKAGVDLIELQIPFSEPVADGPVILRANQAALARGVRVEECFRFAEAICREFPIPFLFMTYYNIVFRYGEERFCQRAAEIGIQGAIVPDLPPEEGESFLATARHHEIAPIMIFAPTSPDERMRRLAAAGDGFVYCVARRGVTGAKTEMDTELAAYLNRCRQATDLPLAVGFGIGSRQDIAFLEGRAEIAVIGTKTIRLLEEKGVEAIGPFLADLR